jgi:hypothetical protein
MDPKEVISGVNDGGAPTVPAVNTPEKVSQPESKLDATISIDKVAKLEENYNNVAIALKQERELNKKISAEKDAQINELKSVTDKLKNVFSDPTPAEPEVKEVLTIDSFEQMWAKKEQEKAYEEQKKKQTELIKSEIADVEKEWNGDGGKPRYNDSEVLKWQTESGKLNLTPRAAFLEMKHNEIIDWAVKSKTTSAPTVNNVMTPGGAPVERNPKEFTPTNDTETKQAILAAMDAYEADSN